MSAREEIETNRLLKELLDNEFEKLITKSPTELAALAIIAKLDQVIKHLEILNETKLG